LYLPYFLRYLSVLHFAKPLSKSGDRRKLGEMVDNSGQNHGCMVSIFAFKKCVEDVLRVSVSTVRPLFVCTANGAVHISP
jgi:hypothetical protein